MHRYGCFIDTTSSYEFDLKASRRVKGDAFGRMSQRGRVGPNFTGRARAKAEGKPKRSTEAHDLCFVVLGSHLGICSFRLELRDEDEIKAIEAEA